MGEESLEAFVLASTSQLSQLCEGMTKEQRRAALKEQLDGHISTVDQIKRNIHVAKEGIENVRVKYENMNELVQTMDQLKCSLEEHIRTVRLNEGSFAGTAAVLEYDNAKARTHTLINVIKAKSQLERAREALAEGGDDQNRVYECLVDMQKSLKTLNEFVSDAFDDRSLEELKDRYLAWQSAALIFAIQQIDEQKILEIRKTYETLGREDEFKSIFQRVCVNRLKEYKVDGSSFQALVDGLYREIEFVFGHNYRALCPTDKSNPDAKSIISDAITDGLAAVDTATPISTLISEDENPIALLAKVEKVLSAHRVATDNGLQGVVLKLNERLKKEVVAPMRSALTSYALTKVNALELTSGSFRQRVESLKTSIVDLIQLLHDMFTETFQYMPEHAQDVVQQAMDKTLESYTVKLKLFEKRHGTQARARTLDELIAMCSASGQLVYGLQEFKTMVESVESSLSPDTKPALKWNRNVVESVLKVASESITSKMIVKMQTIRSAAPQPGASAMRLPTFATSPHEYVTTAGQELLQLFHRWEQFFMDDNVAHAFYIAFKKKYDGEELFKKTVAEVANTVISEFVMAVGDPKSLAAETGVQFLADTVFLKDAFEDLRTGNTAPLTTLEDQLKATIKR